MYLHELAPAPGSKKSRVRVGRGLGSGLGKTSGKGQKGQKSRSGGVKRPGFEGGQKPLYLRLPKRGFYNKFGAHYTVVNVEELNRFDDGAVVDPVSASSVTANLRRSSPSRLVASARPQRKRSLLPAVK